MNDHKDIDHMQDKGIYVEEARKKEDHLECPSGFSLLHCVVYLNLLSSAA
jgi:hypothetical protein